MNKIVQLRFDARRAAPDEYQTLRSVIETAVGVFQLRGTLRRDEIANVLFDVSAELRRPDDAHRTRSNRGNQST
jgi:hypothetical protein